MRESTRTRVHPVYYFYPLFSICRALEQLKIDGNMEWKKKSKTEKEIFSLGFVKKMISVSDLIKLNGVPKGCYDQIVASVLLLVT